MRVKSYHNTESTGSVEFLFTSLELNKLKDKEVLVLDDIYDTGRTLHNVIEKL